MKSNIRDVELSRTQAPILGGLHRSQNFEGGSL